MSDIYKRSFVDLSQPDHKDLLLERLAQDGLATFGAVRSRQEFQVLSDSLGELFIQDDTDAYGVKKVELQAAMAGSYLHTDRASMQAPPNVILIFCAKQSEGGGESILLDARDLYRSFLENYPEALEAFSRPDSVYFGMKEYATSGSVFNQQPDGTVYIKFRFDSFGYFSAPLIPFLPILRKLLDEHTVSFRLNDHQGYAVQNGRWLHGALPSVGGRRIIYRTNLRCTMRTRKGTPVGFGFAVD